MAHQDDHRRYSRTLSGGLNRIRMSMQVTPCAHSHCENWGRFLFLISFPHSQVPRQGTYRERAVKNVTKERILTRKPAPKCLKALASRRPRTSRFPRTAPRNISFRPRIRSGMSPPRSISMSLPQVPVPLISDVRSITPRNDICSGPWKDKKRRLTRLRFRYFFQSALYGSHTVLFWNQQLQMSNLLRWLGRS